MAQMVAGGLSEFLIGTGRPTQRQAVGVTDSASERILASFQESYERNRPWLERGGPDVRFDEFVNFPPEAQAKLADKLFDEIDAGRRRRRKATDKANAIPVIGSIVANAMIAMGAAGPGACVHYSRANGTYQGASLYKPDFLGSKQLRGTIDALAEAGFLVTHTGKQGSFRGERSTYWPTEKLMAVVGELGIADEAVRDPSAPVILLRDSEGGLVEYDPSQCAPEIARIRAYNAFIAQFDIRLAPTTNGPVNLKRACLYRVFNDGSFDKGGRFYGAWWQSCSKELRPHITINGEPTVELDYSAFVPRALYAKRKAECPRDPYDVPTLRQRFEGAGVPWDQARSIIKQLMNIMINVRGGSMKGVNGIEVVRELPPSIPYKWAFEEIAKNNEQISHYFFTGAGLEAMKWESDICSDILDRARQEGIPILPIHDSFRVRERDRAWLEGVMNEMYKKHLQYSPIVK